MRAIWDWEQMLVIFFSLGEEGLSVATYLANLSPPEDSVGNDLGLVVLPWGGHVERSRMDSRPSSGHSSGSEVISEPVEEGLPQDKTFGILCGSWDEGMVGV